MSNKVAEISKLLSQDACSAWVANLWETYDNQRSKRKEEWLESRKFTFATDTSTTSVGSLPWKNSTTIPKLCQIRDNLFCNYKSALFPNDNWAKWQARTMDDATKKKRDVIETYMSNKTSTPEFDQVLDQLLYDYIDFGMAFATPGFEANYKEFKGSIIPDFIGPTASRISPEDIVFNPLASHFNKTFKIVRSVKTIGELKRLAELQPEQRFWAKAIERREDIANKAGAYSTEDFNKAASYQADGFGSLYEYYMGENVEILEFFGDYHDPQTGDLQTDRIITIVDRSVEVRNEPIPTWFQGAPIYCVGWRNRPDNLWAMGPLDNLVGLQYRLDHLENLKADAMDLSVHPPLKVYGEVEEFEYGPGSEIPIDEGGDVQELGKNLNGVMAAASEMAAIEERMEVYAGAPREAAGLRTPGEKTLGEVMQLATAAGRIFQEKTTRFEKSLLEPLLNGMLEIARRNVQGTDVIRKVNKDLGIEEFISVTAEDITANGIIRPIGARHFAKQSQDLQNLISVFNSPLGQMIAPHTSGKGVMSFVEDITGLSEYGIFSEGVALEEQQALQSKQGNLQEEAAAIDSTETIV